MKRRTFTKKSALFAAGTFSVGPMVGSIASGYKRPIAANDKIKMGVIGCNGMGWSDTNSLLKIPEIELVGICDVDKGVINKRVTDYSKLRENKPIVYDDYRKLLEDKDIDVIVIGTPDHWHCKMMIDAVDSGKHVYVEKPVANTIEESRLMVAAAKKSGKMVQVGQWQRSGIHYQQALDLLWSGRLGQVRLVKVWAYQGWMKPVPVLPDSTAPDGVNYKMWLGPAPERPFNPNRFHFNFRWFWDYAGGLMTDWGVHEIDIALYGMKVKYPKSVMATGGKLAYPDDASETPDTLQAVFEYGGFNMLWEHATGIDSGPYQRREGIAYIGNNGTLVLNRDGYEVILEKEAQGYSDWGTSKMESVDAVKRPENLNYLDEHTKNFIEAVKKNDLSVLNTPIDNGSLAAINAQMGNIAYKTGQKIYWDEAKYQFKDNAEANELIYAKYQNGWKLPVV